jgi:membrane protease YdiL (CAAX protease family)
MIASAGPCTSARNTVGGPGRSRAEGRRCRTLGTKPTPRSDAGAHRPPALQSLAVLAGLVAFCAVFLVIDQGYNRFVDARFPPVDGSAWSATAYGVVSRLHLILPLAAVVLWRPRAMGFQLGRTRRHWRLVLFLLAVNCGVVGGYLLLTGGSTPYSGNEWLLTEVLTVPLVEETLWRGAVFAVLLAAFRRIHPEGGATTRTIWASGLAFGLLHGANALVGVPLLFVGVQMLNAAVWGVAYGYARAVTDSIYPPLMLHAAMNLVVVLV